MVFKKLDYRISTLYDIFRNYDIGNFGLKGNKTKGWVMIDQIRTVDKQRISKIFGELSEKEIQNVKSVIKETFVD